VRPRLRSSVWAAGVGGRGEKSARPSGVELAHVGGDLFLVALDGQEIVSALFLHDDPRGFTLGVQGVGRDEQPLDGRAAEKGLGGGDFIRVRGDGLRTQPTSALDGVGADDLLALAVEQFFAVHRHLVIGGGARPQHAVLPVEQGLFEGAAVQMGEQAEEGGFAGNLVATGVAPAGKVRTLTSAVAAMA